MWEMMRFDENELDESERDYLESVIAGGDPDEIERMLKYFGRDCY